MTENPYQPPKEVDKAVRAALAHDLPGRYVSHTKLCAEEPSRLVVRAYLPVANLLPTPYVIYAVDRVTLVASELIGDESEPYEIPNYK